MQYPLVPKSECPDIWKRLPRHKNAQSMVQHQKNQWFLLSEICMATLLPHCWHNSKKFYWTWMGEVLILCIVSKVYFSRYTWMTLHSLERSRTLILCGRNGWNTLIWENLILLLIMCTWSWLNANVNLTKVGFDEKTQSKNDTLSHSICDIRTNNTVSQDNIRSTRKPTYSSVLDLGSWFGMVNDASGLLFMIVQEVVVPGYGWREGEASRSYRGGGERLRCHISRVFGTLMVMSQARPGRGSHFPCVTAPNRRTASWLRRRHSGIRKPQVPLRVAVCPCGGWSGWETFYDSRTLKDVHSFIRVLSWFVICTSFSEAVSVHRGVWTALSEIMGAQNVKTLERTRSIQISTTHLSD